MTRQEQFIATHPAFGEALASFKANPMVHRGNKFAHELVAKFDRFGSLTIPQMNAFADSLRRDRDRVAKEGPKGLAPVGSQVVTGEIVSVKKHVSPYSVSMKMTVKLANNSRVWATVPWGYTAEVGKTVSFRATFEPSKDDPSFAFGKRPELVSSPATPVAYDVETPHSDPGSYEPESYIPASYAPKVVEADAPLPKPEPAAATGSSVLASLLDEYLAQTAATK
jgi:hypothetical protein